MTNQEMSEALSKASVADLEKDLADLLGQVAFTRQMIVLAKARQKPGRQRAAASTGTRKARTPKASAGNGVPAAAETEA